MRITAMQQTPDVVELPEQKSGAQDGANHQAPLTSDLNDGGGVATGKSSKSPAFQFYPKDFLSDHHQVVMTAKEAGIYWRLTSHCWLSGSLPDDMARLARMAGVTTREMTAAWPAVNPCFKQRANGEWTHPRLEKERQKQAEFAARQAANGAKGGRPQKGLGLSGETQTEPNAKPEKALHLHSSFAPTEEQEISPATSAEPYPVLDFPVNGKPSTWGLTQAQVDEWAALYPGIDVLAECRKAKAWLLANHRKTAGGMSRFLVNWLNTATNGRQRPGGIQSVDGPSLEMRRNAEKYADLNGTPTRKVGAA